MHVDDVIVALIIIPLHHPYHVPPLILVPPLIRSRLDRSSSLESTTQCSKDDMHMAGHEDMR